MLREIRNFSLDIFIEESWKKALDKILLAKRIILLGAIDSGKSTFAKYVLYNFIQRESQIAFVDSDVGQSSIAIPGTIGIKRIAKFEDINSFADRFFFFGGITPSVSIIRFLKVFEKAIKTAESFNLPILVDTTGFITGNGKLLKLKKIEILKPELVVGLQRTNEIEHILAEIQVPYILLQPSKNVKPRNPEERANYRKRKLQEYFSNSESYLLPVKMLQIHDKSFIYQNEKYIGRMAGLFSDDECISIGVVEEIDESNIVIRTPLHKIENIRKIVLGEITIPELL
ncbi:Clp1/GlmU family protein [Thermodesulfovibrio hydrogeniphilus]